MGVAERLLTFKIKPLHTEVIKMDKAKPGDRVSLIYDGTIDNGETFESSKDTGPLEFVIGTSQVMPEFEKNIIGMRVNEIKEFTLAPEAAHGPHNPDLVHRIKRQVLKNQEKIKVGTVLSLRIERDGKEHQVPALVTDVQKDSIEVDFNHPLAGKHLTYRVTLQEIKTANEA